MLTLEKFLKLEAGSDFAHGVSMDNPNGLYMNNSDKLLKWIAVKGWADDWCIYTHFADYDFEFVKRSGDKVCDEDNIRKLVSCTSEVFERYRY